MRDTWTCHVCGDARPDEKISVRTHDVSCGGVPIKENVRYCNDRPACVEGSLTFSHLRRPTVDDVIGSPELASAVEKIDREADEKEFRYRAERGMVIPKTLWRKMAKWRRP